MVVTGISGKKLKKSFKKLRLIVGAILTILIMTLVIKFMIKSILQFKGKSLLCSKVGRSCYNTRARGQAGCPEVMKLGNWQNGLFDSDLSVSYIASTHNMTPPLYLYLNFDQKVTWVSQLVS